MKKTVIPEQGSCMPKEISPGVWQSVTINGPKLMFADDLERIAKFEKECESIGTFESIMIRALQKAKESQVPLTRRIS